MTIPRVTTFSNLNVDKVFHGPGKQYTEWRLSIRVYRLLQGELEASLIAQQNITLWKGLTSVVPRWVDACYGSLRGWVDDKDVLISEDT